MQINSNNPDTLVYNFFINIYNFSFRDADKILKSIDQSDLNISTINFLKANYYYWFLVSGNQSEADIRNCRASLDSTISAITLSDENNLSNDDLFNLISAYAFKARIEIHNKNYLRAAKFLKNVIDYLKISLDYINADEKFKLTSGLYYYFMEYSVKKYPFVFPYLMFFPKGDKEKGLKLITECASSKNSIIWTEANYFLMKINLYTENQYSEASTFAERLIEKYPNNLVYNFEYFNILMELKQNEKIKKQFEYIHQISTKNIQLNDIQKQHFVNLAKEKLQNKSK